MSDTDRTLPKATFAECGDGHTLHLTDTGRGAPIVLVHGADGVLLDFPAALVAALVKDHRVIAVDRPGHGHSERVPPGAPPLGPQVERIRGALSGLGATRPIVVGHSYGAALALRWALDHPAELRGLVLLAPAAYFVWPPVMRRLFALPATPKGRAAAEVLVPKGSPVLTVANLRAFWPNRPPEEYLEHAREMFLRPSQFSALAEEYRWLEDDLGAMNGRYGEIGIPVEIVAGSADLVTPTHAEGERLAGEIPDAGFTLVKHAGHQLHWAVPEAVVEAVARLEERCGDGASSEDVTRG